MRAAAHFQASGAGRGVWLLLPLLAWLLAWGDGLARWDGLFYDGTLSAWSRRPPDTILIVAIDERSLGELGRWPWSRHRHAELIRKLSAAGAKGIALEILFAEPDTLDPTADAALAAALADSGRVVLPMLPEQRHTDGPLVETLPLPALAQAAAGIGHVDVELDRDSIARGIHLKAGLGTPRWSSLALALLEASHAGPGGALPGQRATAADPDPGLWRRDYRVLIPFAGPPGWFHQVSYVDVLRDGVDPASFRDAYVLVGATASGMNNALPTPVSGLGRPMSGVEFNANVLDALQRGASIRPLDGPWSQLLSGFLVLGTLGLYALFPPRWTLPLAGLGLALTLAVSLLLLHGAHLWFPPMLALLLQAVSYPLWVRERLSQAIRSLFEKEELAQVTLHSIGDGVITTDTQGRVNYLNPVAEAMLGATADGSRGRPLGPLFQVNDSLGRYQPVDLAGLCLERNAPVKLPEPGRLVNHAGQEYAIRASAAPMRDPRGRLTGVVIVLGDITETHRLTQRMAYQATHDALTDLPNLALLRDRLTQAIARSSRTRRSLALLFVDLDHFKKINESLGHTAGDRLLRAVAARLQGRGRRDDTLARVGGDEFVFLLEGLRQEDRVAEFAHEVQHILRPPFLIDGHECFVTASIGICLCPKDGRDEESLLKNADLAVYRAKDNGRDTIQFYAQDMHVRTRERLTLEQDLRHALERDQLELVYQPQLALPDGRIVGVEALLRWRHPQRGMISPMEFVPLAEESGLVDLIGEWVLSTACQQVMAWRDRGLPPLRMAVNMSPRQFLRADMVERVAHILGETGLESGYLELEITESLLMKDVERGIASMRALKAIGVRLSIDDFGTGYSSLNYLKRFPIDRLKIDKSFLREIETSRDDLAITLAMIAMAHSMGLTVIAEGVENAAQLEFLRANRCDEAQGYHVSEPLPARDIPALLGEPPASAPVAGGAIGQGPPDR